MKSNISKIFVLAVSASMAFTSCIDETYPSDMALAEQVAKDPQALSTIVNGLSSYLGTYGTLGDGDYTDLGMPGFMIARDVMCEDYPVSDDTMDYYYSTASAGNRSTDWGTYPYYYFYTFVDKINNVLKSTNPDTENEELAHMIGNLYGYRAMCFMELARMFEFKKTGFAELDDKATSDNIYGLTVPILEAREYTVAELVQNPRVPFQTMYRFIMTDLNRAEEYLEGYTRSKVSLIDQSVIYGFKARMWLELASRFDESSEDLATQLAAEGADDGYDDLGITTALECYANAAKYAEMVINSGYTPLTSAQWHDSYTGFNTPTSNKSWVFGTYITSETEAPGRYYSFAGTVASDCNWGWTADAPTGDELMAFRCISSGLYDQIPDEDWRKTSWVDPNDVGLNKADKYGVVGGNFIYFPAYANLKFRVPDTDNYQKGIISSVPFMRVEEMYLLLAEALYHTNGIGAAKSKLEDFVNAYRYTDGSYVCNASDYESFIRQLMIQRRIELWGEGLVYYDYKRLRLGVDRTYEGTNFLELYRLKSLDGYVAPWMNIYFSETIIYTKDSNFKGNPYYSGVVTASTSK